MPLPMPMPTPPAAAVESEARCPELVLRNVRWPTTEAGVVRRMHCPRHALPTHPIDPYQASLACQLAQTNAGSTHQTRPIAVWAAHVHIGRCESLWLRNLTQRLEAGDSPVAVAGELAARTRPQAPAMSAPPAYAQWLAHSQQLPVGPAPLSLFGDDLALIERATRKILEETDAVLARINDDKQRSAFASEIAQVSFVQVLLA